MTRPVSDLGSYRVRVRDSGLNIVGELDDYTQLTLNLLFNDVSRWVITAGSGSVAVDLLRSPGSGIIVQRLHPGYADDGQVILSGVWDTWNEVYGDQGLQFNVAGPDDMYVVDDELAYPDITGNFSLNAYDVFSGPAETVLYHYVSGNVGPTAMTTRKTPGGRPALTLAADQGRGSTIPGRARFGRLLDTLQAYALASAPELGFRVVQVGGALQFQVYVPTDRTPDVKFSPELGNVLAYERTQTAPTGNHVIVAGGGAGTARSFLEGEDTTSITTWKRRRVIFRDRRDSTVVAELQQSSTEELARGIGSTGLSVTPIDTPAQQYLVDYGLGDKVSVITRGAEGAAPNTTLDILRAVQITLTGGQAVQVQPTIGQASAVADPVLSPLQQLEKRLLALESVQ
jgi:hypothetical protein